MVLNVLACCRDITPTRCLNYLAQCCHLRFHIRHTKVSSILLLLLLSCTAFAEPIQHTFEGTIYGDSITVVLSYDSETSNQEEFAGPNDTNNASYFPASVVIYHGAQILGNQTAYLNVNHDPAERWEGIQWVDNGTP